MSIRVIKSQQNIEIIMENKIENIVLPLKIIGLVLKEVIEETKGTKII
jgi:hypothetical protein